MNKTSGVTHALAECADCGWTNQCHKNALGTGARHAQSTGHTVRVEQAIMVIYNPKGEELDG